MTTACARSSTSPRPEALLVDCMVRSDCTAKDAIKMLLKDENNTYSKNELYAAHLALKERFGA